jgi:hypothetical protein
MSGTDDGNVDKPRKPRSRPIKSRLSRFEGIIVSRERTFDVLSTIITAIFTVVLALSTALLWKETKDLRNFAQQQSEDMKASIAVAGRAADAMSDVAKSLAASAEATKNANIMQWRAYLTVGFGSVIVQNKETNFRFEVRMTLQNVGNTPAYNIHTNAYADFLPSPLPDDFKFPAFVPNNLVGSNMGPRQDALFTAVANRIYSDDEVHEMEFGPNNQLYVYGTITYEDAFGISRKTNFFQMVLWLKGGGFMSRNIGNFNEAN